MSELEPSTKATGALVIGGGPAGLMAAETIANAGVPVTIADRMPSLGRKLLMAGRGGLNLTHSEPLAALLGRYGAARPHLAPAIAALPPDALIAWCHGLGQPTFVGSSGRVFPKAMKASPLLRAWLRRLGTLGVTVHTRWRWTGWDAAGAQLFETPDGPAALAADATVLALGGASWPRLGSDGAWASALGRVGVAPWQPANCGFDVPWSDIFRRRFEGTPLKRIALTHGTDTVRGEAIITAEGIEGGAVYALSAKLRDALSANETVMLHIDLRPDIEKPALVARLGAPRGGASLSTFLRKAAGLPPVGIGLVQEALHAGARPVDLAGLVKAVPIRLTAPRPLARAISSAGGIVLHEVDERFMLRRHPGVFAAGEMLDWEAPTGGYLLQGALSTGAAAGAGVLGWLRETGAWPS